MDPESRDINALKWVIYDETFLGRSIPNVLDFRVSERVRKYVRACVVCVCVDVLVPVFSVKGTGPGIIRLHNPK